MTEQKQDQTKIEQQQIQAVELEETKLEKAQGGIKDGMSHIVGGTTTGIKDGMSH